MNRPSVLELAAQTLPVLLFDERPGNDFRQSHPAIVSPEMFSLSLGARVLDIIRYYPCINAPVIYIYLNAV